IFLCEEYIKDWRISVTRRRVIQVTAELLICSIHPIPGISLFTSKPPNIKQPPSLPARLCVTHQLDDSFSPYLLFILPMIGRMYLAFRTLLLHSKMFNDAGSRSIGAMNKVSFDLRFVLKTLMTLCPLKALLVFIFTIWLILSWTLRACEM
ncbi:small conductance calcium-activated potassium channel protein, partial [Paragonimus heterotremus]